MIIAAGMSPAWQKIMAFDDLQTGEVNRAREVLECASGKVLNVAIGLRSLEARVHCLSPVGGNPASLIKEEFENLRIPVTWVNTQAKTRTCITILNTKTRQTTELVENAEQLSPDEIEDWVKHFHRLSSEATMVVFSGSLPAGAPSNLISDLISTLKTPVILDIRQEELKASLSYRPFLIKPNREELEWTVGRKLSTTDDVVAAAEELRKAGAQWVVISDGKNPVTVIGPEERCLVFVPAVEKVVNPIGCGDSLTVGIAAGIEEGHSILHSVKWGITCALQNLESLRPARLDRKIMIERASGLTVERLK